MHFYFQAVMQIENVDLFQFVWNKCLEAESLMKVENIKDVVTNESEAFLLIGWTNMQHCDAAMIMWPIWSFFSRNDLQKSCWCRRLASSGARPAHPSEAVPLQIHTPVPGPHWPVYPLHHGAMHKVPRSQFSQCIFRIKAHFALILFAWSFYYLMITTCIQPEELFWVSIWSI